MTTDPTAARCTDPCVACITDESHDPAPTPAAPSAPTDQDARRERYAAALFEFVNGAYAWAACDDKAAWLDEADAAMTVADAELQEMADATVRFNQALMRQNARLRADRAAVLRQAADDWTAHCPDHSDADEAFMDCPCEWAHELRRKADELEAQPAN